MARRMVAMGKSNRSFKTQLLKQYQIMNQENPEALTATERARVTSALEISKEQEHRLEVEKKLSELEARVKIEQARISTQPPISLTLEQAKAAGLTVMEPARTDLRHVPSRTDAHYDELGKLRWSLKSQLSTLRGMRFVFGGDERDDIKLAVEGLEYTLFRIERVIENRTQGGC
jgi:hypothetical protein